MICMVVTEDLQCLKEIALMGGCTAQVWASSQTIGSALKISPQTASRRLISLESQGLITRSIRPDGQYISITKEGEGALRQEYADYCRIFGRNGGHYVIEGTLITGLGEGRYYVSLPGYRTQFIEKLGFEPYPGTLNLRLAPPGIQVRKKLDSLEWITIEGFTADERTFGGARCLPCTIQSVQCAIVVPGRSHYPEDVIEIIAPVNLRNALGLDDRDTVIVEVSA
jgi:riboflavin kinase